MPGKKKYKKNGWKKKFKRATLIKRTGAKSIGKGLYRVDGLVLPERDVLEGILRRARARGFSLKESDVGL